MMGWSLVIKHLQKLNIVEWSSGLKTEKWNLEIHLTPAEIFYIVL